MSERPARWPEGITVSTRPTRRPAAARPQSRASATGKARGSGKAQPGQRQPGRPLPAGTSFTTPGATGLRRAVETRSARPMLLLHQFPPWVVAVVLAGLMMAGLALHGPAGAAALALLAIILGWFAYLSWPRLSPAGRLLRAAVLVVMLTVAVIQARR
jgi:Family of unknown function (DUF6703)